MGRGESTKQTNRIERTKRHIVRAEMQGLREKLARFVWMRGFEKMCNRKNVTV